VIPSSLPEVLGDRIAGGDTVDATGRHAEELAVARRAARAAGELLLERFRTGLRAEFKGRKDVVTEADRESEALVRRLVTAAFPDDVVVGEESEHPPEATVSGRRRWYVDPLDGTTNFVKGLSRWAVSVAFCDTDDRFGAAAIVRPCEGEEIWARRGGGAFLGPLEGGDPRRLDRGDDPEPGDGLSFIGPLHLGRDVVPRIAGQSLSIRVTGSTVSDLADVACGRGELHIGSRQGRWDIAAGALIVAESGGEVTDLAGAPLDGPGDNIVAATPRVHAATLALLRASG
jgi:myo-inositol-1(or 4)-monophosphatase